MKRHYSDETQDTLMVDPKDLREDFESDNEISLDSGVTAGRGWSVAIAYCSFLPVLARIGYAATAVRDATIV